MLTTVFVSCREAAEAAGFHVLRLIHEPAAALLAYNIGQDSSSGKRYSTEEMIEQLVSDVLLELALFLPSNFQH